MTDAKKVDMATDEASSNNDNSPSKRRSTSVDDSSAPEESSKKRPKVDSAETAAPLDLAVTLGYKNGDRIEVQWEIEKRGEEGETEVHWWGASLMEPDGRTTDSVSIRTILYDPYPELGFSSCQEDVIFLGDDLIVSPDSQTQLKYRREGEEEIFWYNQGDLDEQLNEILMGALDKNKSAWKSLTPAQQASIADKISTKKEKLLQVLKEHNDVITSSTIKDVLQKAFE